MKKMLVGQGFVAIAVQPQSPDAGHSTTSDQHSAPGTDVRSWPSHVWIMRPPPKAQFSHAVSLKQTITFSGFRPRADSLDMRSSRSFFLTLTLRPTDQSISMRTKSSVLCDDKSG